MSSTARKQILARVSRAEDETAIRSGARARASSLAKHRALRRVDALPFAFLIHGNGPVIDGGNRRPKCSRSWQDSVSARSVLVKPIDMAHPCLTAERRAGESIFHYVIEEPISCR